MRRLMVGALALLLVVGTAQAGAEPYEDGASASAPSWYRSRPITGWNSSSSQDRIYDIAQIGNRIYIAGKFGGVRYGTRGRVSNRRNLIALDARSGELLWGFNPRVNGTVRSLAVVGNRLYAAGTFTRVKGKVRRGVVALWPGGALVGRFRADAGRGEVRAIVATNSFLYLGGDFQTINGVRREKLARVYRGSGGVDRSWTARADGGSVTALEMPPSRDRLYVGGHFSSLNGARGTRELGALRVDNGSVISSFRHEPGTDVLDMLADGRGRLWIGLDGSGGIAEIVNTRGDLIKRWVTEGDVSAVERIGSRVYFGGHEMGPGDREVATVDFSSPGSFDTSTVGTGIRGGEVLAFHADGRQLWLGGKLYSPFQGFGRVPAR